MHYDVRIIDGPHLLTTTDPHAAAEQVAASAGSAVDLTEEVASLPCGTTLYHGAARAVEVIVSE